MKIVAHAAPRAAPQSVQSYSDELGHARRALAAAKTTMRLIERTAHIGTFDIDVITGARTWSDELYRIFGLPPGSVVDGGSYLRHIDPAASSVFDAIRRAFEFGVAFRLEHRIMLDDGTQRWVENSAQPVLDAAGTVVRLFGTMSDITARKRTEQQLWFLAHHDALTGLPNALLLTEKLAAALAAAASSGRRIAVIFIDLDDFKKINDTYGHAVGDRVIRGCAESLIACVRPSDVVARVGGDEFVVVLSELESDADAAGLAQRMRAALAEPIAIAGVEIGIGASFGISFFPDDGEAPEQLIACSDLAMYEAKRTRRRSRLQR